MWKGRNMHDNYSILCEIRDLGCGDETSKKAKRLALRSNPEKIQAMFKACSVKSLKKLFAHADRYAENAAH